MENTELKLPGGKILVITAKTCKCKCGVTKTLDNTSIRKGGRGRNSNLRYFATYCKSCMSKKTKKRASKVRREITYRQRIRRHLDELNCDNIDRKRDTINRNINELFALVWKEKIKKK